MMPWEVGEQADDLAAVEPPSVGTGCLAITLPSFLIRSRRS